MNHKYFLILLIPFVLLTGFTGEMTHFFFVERDTMANLCGLQRLS